MRIVSLIASATEIVHALGLGASQVGRSHECDYPASVLPLPVCSRPRFAVDGSSAEIDRLVKQTMFDAGSVYDILEDVLDRLQPTHVLTQTQCRVCAVSLDDVEKAISGRFASRPRVIGLEPNSLEGIWRDIHRIGNACRAPDAAAGLVRTLTRRMEEIAAATRHIPEHPAIACIEWIEPLMAAGNWTPQLLSMLGARNLFGDSGKHSPWLEWTKLVEADPDVLLIAPCGFDLPRTESEMYWLVRRPEWNRLRAVRAGRVYLADGNQYFNRPGPRVADTLQILAEILYPEFVPAQFRNIAWKRFPGV